MPGHFLKQQLKYYGEACSNGDILQGCHDNLDSYTCNGDIVETDKYIMIRDYGCISGSSSPDTRVTISCEKETSGYQDNNTDHVIACYNEKRNNMATNSSDTACNGGNRKSASNCQDEGLPDGPLDLSMSSTRNSSLSSISTCLQDETYCDISQYSRSTNQSRSPSPDLVSPAAAAVDLSVSVIRKRSLSPMPTRLQEEAHSDFNKCSESTNRSPIAPADQVILAAAAVDLSVSKSSLSSTSKCLQKETHTDLNQSPHSTKRSPIVPSDIASVSQAAVCFESSDQVCPIDNKERHLCSKILPFSSANLRNIQPAPRNIALPAPEGDSLGPITRKRSASPESEEQEHPTNLFYKPGPSVRPGTSSVFSTTSSIASVISSISSTISSVPSLAHVTVLDSSIRTSLSNTQSQSPPHSSRKKRAMSDDDKNELFNDLCSKDSSNTDVALQNKCNNAKHTTATSMETPAQDGTFQDVQKTQMSIPISRKSKTVRRLNFDIDTTSPVSGTIIKQVADLHPEEGIVVCDDIDPTCNLVEVTAEAKAELGKIQNVIGDYICQLCKAFYEDAFKLAQHRCSRIVHVEYRCAECEKVFNCPANLASHSRWHKPRSQGRKETKANVSTRDPASTQRKSLKSELRGIDLCTKDSVRQQVSAAKSVSARYFDGRSNNSLKSKIILSGTSVYESSPSNRERCILGNAKRVTNSSNFNDVSQKTSNCQKDGPSVVVNYKQAEIVPFEDVLENTPEYSTNPISNSLSDQCLNSKPWTFTESNILHTTCDRYGSRLTPEERLLVREVLNSHSLHSQTTFVADANTVTTRSLADCISNSDKDVNTNISKRNNNPCCARMNDCISRVTCDIRANLCLGNDASGNSVLLSSYPRPVNGYHGRELEVKQTQKVQIPAVLSERQGNQQNECSVCGKRFQRQSYLHKHIEREHTKQNKACLFEGKISADNRTENASHVRDSYTSGKSSDSGCTDTSLYYSKCDKDFAIQAVKRTHDAVMHRLTPPLACSTCGMTFTSKTAVDKHRRCTHSVEIYPCKHCPSTFHSSPSLTRHINKCHPTENRQVILLQLPSVHSC